MISHLTFNTEKTKTKQAIKNINIVTLTTFQSAARLLPCVFMLLIVILV